MSSPPRDPTDGGAGHAPAASRGRPALAWRSRNVVLLGLVSLLTDTATEIILPLLPVFLTTSLGAGALAIGWIEGLADATASVLKLLAGRWADRLGRHRPLVLAGYAISSCARPFVAATTSVWQVLAVRMTDRVGKGIRTSPRDALLAASVPPEAHAAAFSLHRAMDHAGAVLGPLLAAAYLTWVSQDLRPLFWLTAIPGAAALLVLWLFVEEARPVREPIAGSESRTDSSPLAWATTPAAPELASPAADEAAVPPLDRVQLLRFLVPLALFTLGNASDVFLLLRAGGARAPLATLPLLWMGLHVVKSAASIPSGRLADRVGRRRVIALGWCVYAAVYSGFAYAETPAQIWGLFLVYGLYHGLSEGPERALIAACAPPRARGTSFGWFHLTLGALSLAASLLFGALWESFGARSAFLTSAALALLAVVALGLLRPAGATPAAAHSM